KRRETRSWLQQYKRFALKHTWTIPLTILAIFLSLYAVNPTSSNPIHRFIFISYAVPPSADAGPDTPIQYGKGPRDIAFFLFYMVVLSFTREFIMQELLRPLALYYGIKGKGTQSRFMEQMYTAIYFGFIGPFGLYVMSRTPVWYFHTRGMYEDFPHKTNFAEFKFYYLFQGAYWAQQGCVMLLGLEKPRKDFKELVGHHIVTLALIGLSYRFHFTYMGLAVFITHDISDCFFAISKSLHYIDHPLVGPYFCFVIVAWVYLRHYINLRILFSEFTEFKTVGPYVMDWDAGQYKSPLAHYVSTALLASLQALNLFWLFLILRTGYRFIFLNQVADPRSEDEDEEEEEEILKKSLDVKNELVVEDIVQITPSDKASVGEKRDSTRSRSKGVSKRKGR
ncbi:TLC domain-containing protein, partial [Leptodontidium sp. MPI-SDFR-AT-0119]